MKHWLSYVGTIPLLLTLAWPISVFLMARVKRSARQQRARHLAVLQDFEPVTRKALILNEVELLDISGQRVRLPRRTVLSRSPHLYWIFGIVSSQNFTFSDSVIQAAVEINSAQFFEDDRLLLEAIVLSAHKDTCRVWTFHNRKPPVKSAIERLLDDDELGVK